ncbi:unnamed protein product [Prorocentrum cordatum]|uniref:Uncharacterized protein n=1 Tax=Prorocentrum cordatum TaxID=2364126 RepID=A0ABN9V3A3_9DINO|nr:unnamed protein product [Polarella glacialis]
MTYMMTLNLDEGGPLADGRGGTTNTDLHKRTLTRFRMHNHGCDVDEAISRVIHAINDLDKVGSHSPFMHVFGIGAPGQLRPATVAERVVVELRSRENLGAAMSDIIELARRSTFDDLTSKSRPELRNSEPQASAPAEDQLRHRERPGPYSEAWPPPSNESDSEMFAGYLKSSNDPPIDQLGCIDEGMTVYSEMLKDKIEFHWTKLSAQEEAEFRGARHKEVRNWKRYEGLKPVPMSEVQDPADEIRCHWVLQKADGTARARLVRLGHQTKDVGKEPTASPTACRRARNILLSVAATNDWSLAKGDVTSAVLQANDLKKDLFVEADEVLSSAVGVRAGEVLRAAKPGCGMGEAPRQWWQTVKQDFAMLGLSACSLEPCLWSLWTSRSCTYGTWEDMEMSAETIEQSGVVTERNENWFFKHKRKILGGEYRLFLIANGITKIAKFNRTDGIWTFKHVLPGCGVASADLRVITWCDAAWASRLDGHSPRGHVTALSNAEQPFSEVSNFTEASDAEGEQMMVRLVLYEVLYGGLDLQDRHAQLADGMTKARQ